MDVPCPACGSSNPREARFCANCGTALAAGCPTCGSPIAAGQRFCANCGTALTAAAPAARAAERRVCSVLFCDLVGFTPISEARDPEVVRALLSQYFEVARTVIGRYGGVVEKFIGDAVMAVWGARTATEDDAERAVRAALELVDAVDALAGPTGVPGLAARAGVVTAEVAVDPEALGEGLVAGDAVNTAARIQSAAESGQVLLDATTALLVRAAVEVVAAGERPLKGKVAPVPLHRAVRVLANIGGVQRIDGLEGPLIGRDLELRLVKDLFHATVERGSARLVLVTGAAGSGKSRLGWEFEKYVDGLADSVFWHRGRCLSYGDGVTFWALAEMVRQRLGIADDDPTDVALTLLLTGLDEHVPDATEREFVGIRLGRLLAVRHPADDGRDFDRNDLFAGWRTWLTRLADAAPVVWVIEDLQYADSGLLEFIDHLLDWSRRSPIHLLAMARTELEEASPSWASGRHRHQIALEPLSDADLRRIVRSLVLDAPDGAIDRITEQARGVPLFAVETIRALIDRDVVVPVDGVYRLVGDVDELGVPDSLRALFAARLDHLDAGLRDLVATAGVLGTTFPAEALAAVSGNVEDEVRADLARLVARDLFTVSADPLSPQRGNYSFTHDLLQRVAVETLARQERRARHLRVAEHLRATLADAGDEVAEVIARHLLDAVEAVPEAPDARDLTAVAVRELERAAQRAERVGAPRRASANWRLAAEHAEDDARAARMLESAAEASMDAHDLDDAIRLAEAAGGRYSRGGDARGVAMSEVLVARALNEDFQYAAARARLTGPLELLRAAPDLRTAEALRVNAGIAVFTRAPDARRFAEEAVRLGERLAAPDPVMTRLLVMLGLMHSFEGERARAEAAYREAARLAIRAGAWRSAAVALTNLSADMIDFDPASALETALVGMDDARRAGSRMFMGVAAENACSALVELGRWHEAESLLEEVASTSEVTDVPYMQVAVARQAALHGDARPADRLRVELGSDEDVETRAFVGYLSALAASGSARPDLVDLARSVVDLRTEVGINLSPVRHSWTIGARAAHAIDRDAETEFLSVLDAYEPTELSPSLRAERLVVEARLADDPEVAFPAAIAAERASSAPHLLAEGLLDWAEHRLETGRARDAAELIDEAAEIVERLGAKPIGVRVSAIRARAAQPAEVRIR